jgi:dTMP kinase
MEEVREINLWAVDGLLPTLTVLLDLDASEARARRNTTGTEPDRMEREKIEYFEATRQAFLKLASNEPDRFFVVDAAQSVETMQAQIRARVNAILG